MAKNEDISKYLKAYHETIRRLIAMRQIPIEPPLPPALDSCQLMFATATVTSYDIRKRTPRPTSLTFSDAGHPSSQMLVTQASYFSHNSLKSRQSVMNQTLTTIRRTYMNQEYGNRTSLAVQWLRLILYRGHRSDP